MRSVGAVALVLFACGGSPPEATANAGLAKSDGGSKVGAAAPTPIRFRIAAAYPHDRQAFTPGLLVRDGRLVESTGQLGHSGLREVEIESGRVLRSAPLPPDEFGEGLALVGGRLVQLTWRNGLAHGWDPATFSRVAEWSYDGEGWGLAFDGRELVQSDGSARLTFRSPETFAVTRTLDVRRAGAPQFYLNELEWIDGAIWANVWMSDEIVRIDPATGAVTGVLDAGGLLAPEERRGIDVLNGIAWDEKTRRLYVTGKYWPKLFALEIEEPTQKR
jgi:glutaminyl-peptide cyclotransferase